MVKFLVALKIVHWAGIVEKYALIVLITYLTDVWEIELMHAAGLINLWVGTTKLLQFAFLFLLDCIRNSYSMLIFSITASGMGMGLMWISTPSWLYSRITGSCSEYTMKCISERQQSLFYIALILIMIGTSAREATMETIKFKGNVFQRGLTKCIITCSDKQVNLIVGFLFSLTTSWSLRFGLSAVFSFVALYLLKGKSWSHKLDINEPEKSPVTTVVRVFFASVLKTFKVHPYDPSTKILKNDIEKDDPQLPQNSSIRLLEMVEESKTLVRILPTGVVFVFLGILSSMVNTYFITQGEHLNPSIIIWNPLYSLIIISIPLDPSIILTKFLGAAQLFSIYEFAKSQFQKFTRKPTEGKRKYSHLRDMKSAMVYAILCCLVAALVGKSRLNVISKNAPGNKPENIIPMRTFWLIPQFVLLGMVDGLTERSMEMFFIRQMPSSLRNYGILVSKGFMGIGTVCSVLFVYVIGKISKMGGRPSWFQHNMENSRLDLFYWLLMVLCVVVSVTWVMLSKCVTLAWNKRLHLNYNEDHIRKVLVPGRDMNLLEDGEIGNPVIEAIIVEYIVAKSLNKNLGIEQLGL